MGVSYFKTAALAIGLTAILGNAPVYAQNSLDGRMQASQKQHQQKSDFTPRDYEFISFRENVRIFEDTSGFDSQYAKDIFINQILWQDCDRIIRRFIPDFDLPNQPHERKISSVDDAVFISLYNQGPTTIVLTENSAVVRNKIYSSYPEFRTYQLVLNGDKMALLDKNPPITSQYFKDFDFLTAFETLRSYQLRIENQEDDSSAMDSERYVIAKQLINRYGLDPEDDRMNIYVDTVRIPKLIRVSWTESNFPRMLVIRQVNGKDYATLTKSDHTEIREDARFNEYDVKEVKPLATK